MSKCAECSCKVHRGNVNLPLNCCCFLSTIADPTTPWLEPNQDSILEPIYLFFLFPKIHRFFILRLVNFFLKNLKIFMTEFLAAPALSVHRRSNTHFACNIINMQIDYLLTYFRELVTANNNIITEWRWNFRSRTHFSYFQSSILWIARKADFSTHFINLLSLEIALIKSIRRAPTLKLLNLQYLIILLASQKYDNAHNLCEFTQFKPWDHLYRCGTPEKASVSNMKFCFLSSLFALSVDNWFLLIFTKTEKLRNFRRLLLLHSFTIYGYVELWKKLHGYFVYLIILGIMKKYWTMILCI